MIYINELRPAVEAAEQERDCHAEHTMNAQNIYNQGYGDGYSDGFFKGYEAAKNEAEQHVLDAFEELKASKAKIKGLHTAIVSLAKGCEDAMNECAALRSELARLYKEADKFDDGIDWIQRAMQAEAKIEMIEKQIAHK